MALPADSFATGTGRALSVDEAFARLAALPCITGSENVSLADADGRVLAVPLEAREPLPGFDHSAVDGVALRAADVPEGGAAMLRLVDRVPAGTAASRPLAPGEAARIFTGAPLPRDADTVAMQEHVRFSGGMVEVPGHALRPGGNIRRAGEELPAGSLALAAGRSLGPAEVGLAAALGYDRLPVRLRLRVGLFSSGNELAGAAAGTARHDANRPMLAALVRRLGGLVEDLGILPDHAETIATRLRGATERCDLLLGSGGVSVGEEDHVGTALARIGRAESWTLSMKPGRRLMLGVAEGVGIIGLPGNPVAAFVAFLHVARPALLALGGAKPKPLQPLPAQARFTYAKPAGRRDYLRGTATAEQGVIGVTVAARDGSGQLSSLTGSGGLVVIDDAVTSVEPGDPVGFLPLGTGTLGSPA